MRLIYFLSVFIFFHCSDQAPPSLNIAARISQITRRSTWSNHSWILPPELLKRAYSIVGDDSRLVAFVRKLVLGQPVQYAHLGGSISVFGLAKTKDGNWHAMFHKWMELTFTSCGDIHPNLSPRDPWPTYSKNLHICPPSPGQDHPVVLMNHAVGATSCVLAEKCIVQKINKTNTDFVLIEYTLNAMAGISGVESLDTPERMALERLLRKLLLLPSQPGIALLHCYSVNYGSFAPQIEDWHDFVVRYYGKVQSISHRAVVYELLKRHNITSNHDPMEVFMGDGLHPGRYGHLVLANIMIYTLTRLAKQVMGELLLEQLNAVQQSSLDRSPPQSSRRSPPKLPEPLIAGNSENSDGYCMMGIDLQPFVHEREGWEWIDESLWTGRHKYGYVSLTVGSKLVIEIDSSLSGVISESSGSRSQVMIGYFSSYERVGSGRISCIKNCKCDTVLVNALWSQKYSATNFAYLSTTPHQRCRIQVEVLPPIFSNSSSSDDTKFKIEGVIVNNRPYLWAKGVDAGAQIDLMTTDALNNIN